MMLRLQLQTLIIVVLSLLTLLVVGVSIMAADTVIASDRLLELSAFSLLSALAILLSVPLPSGELSIVHVVGMMALLSLPEGNAAAMTVAIFAGSLLGSAISFQMHHYRTHNHRRLGIYEALSTTARSTLAFYLSCKVYTDLLHGPLPLGTSDAIADNFVELTAYSLTYVFLHFMTFVLQSLLFKQDSTYMQRENPLVLALVILVPVPFAFIGANVARTDQSLMFFIMTMIGAALIIFGLFALSRSRQRMRRQIDEMRSISVATQALRSNLDLQGLLRTTYVQVSQLLEVANFTVVLQDKTEMRLTYPLVIRSGQELEITDEDGLPDDYGLIEHIIKNRLPLLIRDRVQERAQDLGVKAPQKPVHSWLGVPIISGNQAQGAFVLQSFDERSFDTDDLRLMNIIGSSASIAIDNANLYTRQSIRAEQLARLSEVAALLTETLSPLEVLDTIVVSASTISDADAVGVFLFREDKTTELVLARSTGLSEGFSQSPIPPLLSIPPAAGETAQPVIVIEHINRAKVPVLRIRQRLMDEGVRALIETPLVIAGNTLGFLSFYYKSPRIFHGDQIDLIQAFVTQAAQAVHNARTFASTDRALERRVEQLYTLAAMGRVLSATMNIGMIYDVVLSYATDVTSAPRGLVVLYRQAAKLHIASQRGYPAGTLDDPEIFHQGLTGRVLQSGQMIRVSDTHTETGYLPLVAQTRSVLIAPIFKRSDVLGILMLESDEIDAFSEGDGHFVIQLVNQAVIASDNTMLFQRVKQARDNLQLILDAMEEGIILINEDGQVAMANPRVDLINLTPENLLNRPLRDLLQLPHLELGRKFGFANDEALRHTLDTLWRNSGWNTHDPYQFEVHSDEFGIRYIERQIIAVRDDHHNLTGILFVFYNQTEERELELARESIGQMIIHDLRSPLTAVSTSMRLLQELVPKDHALYPVVDRTSSASLQAVRKVLARVDSLLDVSKMESGEIRLERELTDLSQIVAHVRDDLEPLAQEIQVTITTDVSANLPLLDLDADKIERMLLNLVDNALKYSPSQSQVTIRAYLNGGSVLHLAVIDQGPGIPDEYKRHLFDRFVQIEGRKTVRRGVGLGLTFCKLVAEAHGGEIAIADNPEGGSIFTAILPVNQSPA